MSRANLSCNAHAKPGVATGESGLREGNREVPSDMSNASRISFRGSGMGCGRWVLWFMFALLLSASGATAAEIVEVRVGRHAEFTRVVFELDRQVGYRIERSSPTADASELVVSLEATSIPRRIQSSSSLIEQVEVEPDVETAPAEADVPLSPREGEPDQEDQPPDAVLVEVGIHSGPASGGGVLG